MQTNRTFREADDLSGVLTAGLKVIVARDARLFVFGAVQKCKS